MSNDQSTLSIALSVSIHMTVCVFAACVFAQVCRKPRERLPDREERII